ncbi:uncharacterized protein LOC134330505 [Trichomycterus rosablanca]|uniref:uncharacterized protein LOC134330505 n=1 Tax=Trichomycterus rosablanca TaxID=2290929 RepID=UPI002F3530A5
MASAAERNTVWVGFMDTVPVIGTVKEVVEWVLALYEGNKVVVLEKEKAIFQLVREPLDERMKRLALTEKPEEAGAAASKSALLDIKEVKQDELLGFLSCAKRGQKKPAKTPEKEKAEKQQEPTDDFLRKILPVKPNYKMVESLKEERNRSKQGEHVFNKDILKFHLKLLQDFLNGKHFQYNQEHIKELGKHTLDSNTEKEIQTNMKVHFDEKEFYVNANAILYGKCCADLRIAFHNILNCRNPVSVTDLFKEKLELIIDSMNNNEIYVDKLAKAKWINNDKDKEKRFYKVKGKVVNMYKNERGQDWIINVMEQLEPLLNT